MISDEGLLFHYEKKNISLSTIVTGKTNCSNLQNTILIFIEF